MGFPLFFDYQLTLLTVIHLFKFVNLFFELISVGFFLPGNVSILSKLLHFLTYRHDNLYFLVMLSYILLLSCKEDSCLSFFLSDQTLSLVSTFLITLAKKFC